MPLLASCALPFIFTLELSYCAMKRSSRQRHFQTRALEYIRNTTTHNIRRWEHAKPLSTIQICYLVHHTVCKTSRWVTQSKQMQWLWRNKPKPAVPGNHDSNLQRFFFFRKGTRGFPLGIYIRKGRTGSCSDSDVKSMRGRTQPSDWKHSLYYINRIFEKHSMW